MSNLEAAREYRRRGFYVVPTAPGSKGPKLQAWQELRIAEEDLPRYFTNGQGVGWLLGIDGLTDVDCDCREARDLAPAFLPATDVVHGRPGAPRSHHWFIADPLPEFVAFNDPDSTSGERERLLELRTTGQTLVPPSVHPNGELLRWERDGEPAHVDGRELAYAVRRLAACTLLSRHWPGPGRRDELAMAVAGGLIRADWDLEDVDHFIARAAEAAGDEEVRTRLKARRTARAISDGKHATGWPTVAEILGKAVTDKLTEWLNVNRPSTSYGMVHIVGAETTDGVPHFPLTDSGNGELFAHLYGDRLRYNVRRDKWLTWAGHWWQEDTGLEVERLALEAARERQRSAADIADPDTKKRVFAWGVASESQAKKAAALASARSVHPLTDTGDEWDSNPDLLGVANGVIDLRLGQLRPGRREDRITLHTPIEYDSHARAPRWERFISEIFGGDDELVDYLHRYVGYCLTGHTRDQSLVFAYGIGANGKSTLLTLLRKTLGQHGHHTAMTTLLAVSRPANGPSTELAALAGKRVVTAIETNEGVRLNEALIKALTGNDPLTARHLYEREVTFTPEARFFLAFNHKPRVTDDSFGFWRRVRFIPFEQQFDPEAEPDLPEKLEAELPGILAWAVRGCLAWRERGLKPPARVVAATAAYREESDPLGDFVRERCEEGEAFSVIASEFYLAYKAWAEEQGYSERERLTATAFGRRMGERYHRDNARVRVYHGIRLGTSPPTPDKPSQDKQTLAEPEPGTDTGVMAGDDGELRGLEGENRNSPGSIASRGDFLENPRKPSQPSQPATDTYLEELCSRIEQLIYGKYREGRGTIDLAKDTDATSRDVNRAVEVLKQRKRVTCTGPYKLVEPTDKER